MESDLKKLCLKSTRDDNVKMFEKHDCRWFLVMTVANPKHYTGRNLMLCL